MKEIVYSKSGIECENIYIKLSHKSYLFGRKLTLPEFIENRISKRLYEDDDSKNRILRKLGTIYKYEWFSPITYKDYIIYPGGSIPTWMDSTILTNPLAISFNIIYIPNLHPNNANFWNGEYTSIKIPVNILKMIESSDMESIKLGVDIFKRQMILRYKSGM